MSSSSGPGRGQHPALAFLERNRTQLIWATAGCAAAYAAYRASASSCSPSDQQQPGRQPPRSQLQRLLATVSHCSSAATNLAETASLVSSDLRAFLTSDAQEMPQSLRQLTRLLRAPELQEALSAAVASCVRGVERSGVLPVASTSGATAGPGLTETVLEALLSERGRGLVGVAVGVAARNATTTVCEFMERRLDAASAQQGSSSGGLGSIKDIMDMFSSEQGERLVSLLITKSIRTAISTYVESTSGYNMYDDMLASISKQDNRDAVTDVMTRITAAFCRELAAAYRKATMRAAANASSHPHHHTSGGAVALSALATVGAASSSSCCSSTISSCSSSVSGKEDADPRRAAGHPTCDAAAALLSAGADAAAAIGKRANGSSGGGALNRLAAAATAGSRAQQQLGSAPSAAVGAVVARQQQQPLQPAWLRQVVDLAKERDVRTLAVDVVMNASREATRGAIQGFLYGAPGSSADGSDGKAMLARLGVQPYQLYIMASLAVSLIMYALSPHVLVL